MLWFSRLALLQIVYAVADKSSQPVDTSPHPHPDDLQATPVFVANNLRATLQARYVLSAKPWEFTVKISANIPNLGA